MEKPKLFLFNTLTREKEEFKPIKAGEVGMYTCGPTVYWYQHIGNLRAYLFADTLRRTLEYNKLKVKQITNITDVGHLTSDADEGEDKIERAARKEGKPVEAIANHYFSVFEQDLKKLNILAPFKWTKATEHIKEQIEIIKKLEAKGYTYKTSDGIYYNSTKFKDYAKLGKLKIEGLQEGKRIEMGEKKHPTDFALWKFSNPDEKRLQEWDSPWGVGFPGWHIECSAMSMKYLGEHFDIHTGGEDHVPIHHTNEIAQSEAATGKKFVNYWLHVAFLTNKSGEKISKSKGGLYTLSELEAQGYKPEHYRYFCLQTHYKKPLIFTLENLDASKNAFERIARKILELKAHPTKGKEPAKTYETEFLEAINDDLNTPKAIQVLLKLLDEEDIDSKAKLELIEKFDEALGLGLGKLKETKTEIPEEVQKLANERKQLRKAKKWAESDILRNRIKELGFTLEDSPQGARLTKI